MALRRDDQVKEFLTGHQIEALNLFGVQTTEINLLTLPKYLWVISEEILKEVL